MKKQKREIESYPTRNIRIAEEEWEKLKAKKVESGLSWNQFVQVINNFNYNE